MSGESLSRRLFLKGSGSLAGSALLRAGIPGLAAMSQAACTARDAGADFDNMTASEAREYAAIAARILPTTETPGATEAGAIYFFDQALGGLVPRVSDYFPAALADLQAAVTERFSGAERFSELDDVDQDRFLASIEDSDFFLDVRFLTLAGVFGMAKYGGNRDAIGWKLVGMDGPPRAWTYPFGDYDAEHTAGNGNDA